MKSVVKILFVVLSVLYLSYLALPIPSFPDPPPDALQSQEPADTETPLRRAYFTNFTREEVLSHYQNKMTLPIVGLTIPTYRLNYPPEEAYTMIRDQTRSTFLEEVLHPFRESLYVNGFEPKNEKDTIIIEDKKWRQKITVRYIPNTVYERVGVGVLIICLVVLVYKTLIATFSQFKKLW